MSGSVIPAPTAYSRLRGKRIPVAGPQITDEEVALVADAARNGWYENANTYIHQFERMMADYCGVRFAIAVSHATSAIHLALETLGVIPL